MIKNMEIQDSLTHWECKKHAEVSKALGITITTPIGEAQKILSKTESMIEKVITTLAKKFSYIVSKNIKKREYDFLTKIIDVNEQTRIDMGLRRKISNFVSKIKELKTDLEKALKTTTESEAIIKNKAG